MTEFLKFINIVDIKVDHYLYLAKFVINKNKILTHTDMTNLINI